MNEGDLVRQYRIGPKLGQGGMGVVYKGCLRNLKLGVDKGYINISAMQNRRYFDLTQVNPRLQPIIELARRKQEAFTAGYGK